MRELILRDALNSGRWACYAPTDFCPLEDPTVEKPVSRETLREDLQVVRPFFDSLITYGIDHGLDLVPTVASEVDPPYKQIIVGIWHITVEEERHILVDTVCRHFDSQSPCKIMGVCVGNEGVWFGRYSLDTLEEVLGDLRNRLPDDVALTTSEPIPYQGEYAIPETLPIEFHLPTIHPFFTPVRNLGPEQSAEYVVEKVMALSKALRLPCLVKETGWPSGGGKRATSKAQYLFWHRLLEMTRGIVSEQVYWSIFELFDAGDWKIQTQGNSSETHWGWFSNNQARSPKRVASLLENHK